MSNRESLIAGGWKMHHCFASNIRPPKIAFVCSLLVVTLFWLHGIGSSAAIFTINDPSDTTNATSLRGAIIGAMCLGGTNTILLENDSYSLTSAGADEDSGYTGDLNINNGNLTIIGMGSEKVIIDATALGDRVFQISSNAQLTLSNLTLAGGTAPAGISDRSGGDGEDGGGIYNQGMLTLANCIVSGNSSGRGGDANSGWGTGGNGGNGAGIYNSGTLVLRDSLVFSNLNGFGGDGGPMEGNFESNNQGGNGGDGGGIYNVGTLIVNDCTICDNTNGTGGILYGNDGNGGGIYSSGTLLMSNTIVANNSNGSDGVSSGTGGIGGGILNLGSSTLNQCLIRNNSAGTGGGANISLASGGGAGGCGGGIFNGGCLILSNCTVEENSGGTGAGGGSESLENGSMGVEGGVGGSGGGIYNTNLLTVRNCTISGNRSGWGGPGGNAQGELWGGNGGNGGNGGGLFNIGSITSVLCTVSGNFCGGGGSGGVGILAGAGGAGGSGAGIYNIGAIAVMACTVSRNLCGNGGMGGDNFNFIASPGGTGGNGGSGGGIFDDTNSQPVNFADTLVALNQAGTGGAGGNGSSGISVPAPPPAPPVNGADGMGLDVEGRFVSGGFNLVGEADGSMGLTNGINNDLIGNTNSPINPLLGPLQNNGGPTLTQALLFGSPAVDQGNSFGLTGDQRGHPRAHDYYCISNALGGDSSDIGAFESDTPILNFGSLNGNILILWDTNQLNYKLEWTSDLTLSTGWTPMTGVLSIVGREFQMIHQSTLDHAFFRLRSNP